MANIVHFPNPPGVWIEPQVYPTVPEILGCKPDNGDVQLAYRILGLHATPARPIGFRPSPKQFTEWCNKLLRRVWLNENDNGERDVVPGSVAHKRVIEANKRILSAMHTIAGIRRPGHPDWSPNFDRIKIQQWHEVTLNGILIRINGDLPRNITSQTWARHVEVPMDLNPFNRHYARADVAQLARDRPRTGKTWMPTHEMVFDAQEREDEDIFDDLACYGFVAKPHYKYPEDKVDDSLKEDLEHKFWAGPTPKNEDSLWYSLALLVEDNPTKAKEIKARAAEWFRDMLYDRQPNRPGNPHRTRRPKRFRMYSQLLADSAGCADPDDEEIWGKMNMFRALCSNRPDAGMPKEAGYHEMLYMLADFFHTEIITFTRPKRETLKLRLPGETIKKHAYFADFAYEMRVYGEQPNANYHSFKFRHRKQILLVTDSCLRYFQPVTHVYPTMEEERAEDGKLISEYLDTAVFDPWDRHLPMPWWPGFRRNDDNTGWTGDWDDPQLRPGLRNSTVWQPLDIWDTLYAWAPGGQVLGQRLDSPYEMLKNLNQGLWDPWRTWFEGDEDCDLWNMVQPARLRLSWRDPESQKLDALNNLVPDAAIGLSGNRARTGAKVPKYPSKRRPELIDAVEEAFLDNPNMGETESGWMKVVVTEREDRESYWHKPKRRRLR